MRPLLAALVVLLALPAVARADVVGTQTTSFGTTSVRFRGASDGALAVLTLPAREGARSRGRRYEVQCRRSSGARWESRVTIVPLSDQRRLTAPSDGARARERCRVRRGSVLLATMTLRTA